MGRRSACSLALVLALACSSEKDAAAVHPDQGGTSPSEDADDDTHPGGELPRSDDDVPSDDDDTPDDALTNPDDDGPTDDGLDDDGPDDDAVGPVDRADGNADDDTFVDNNGGTGGTGGASGDEGNAGSGGTMSAGPDGGAAGSSQNACSCDGDVNGDGLISFFAEDSAAVSQCLGLELSTPCATCRGGTCAAADIDCNGLINECDSQRISCAEVGTAGCCDVPCGACCVADDQVSTFCSGGAKTAPCCREFEEETCTGIGAAFLGADLSCPASCPVSAQDDTCVSVTGAGAEPWLDLMVSGSEFGAYEGARIRLVASGNVTGNDRLTVAQTRVVDGAFTLSVPEGLNYGYYESIGLYVDEDESNTCDIGEASWNYTTGGLFDDLVLEVTPAQHCDSQTNSCLAWSGGDCTLAGLNGGLAVELACPQ